MIEEWKDTEYIGYKVSNLGRIKNEQGKILKTQIRKGYCDVGLHIEGQRQPKIVKVHRLVAKAFIPNPNNYPLVNHKDENKQNNRVDNLEWCTQKYNLNYGHRNDKIKKKVLQFDSDNNFIKEYKSITDASKECNVLISDIVRSCKTHYKAGNFIWKYA